MGFVIRITCKDGHTETLRSDLAFQNEGWTRSFAGWLDGSSAFWRNPPHPSSSLGRCGICGARFKCEVVEEIDGKVE